MGKSDAVYSLGICYENGEGVTKGVKNGQQI